jgi:ribosomal-protein-alanine N-acetyltransferase
MPGYFFKLMSDEEARQISHWHYEPPYDFYDATSDEDDLEELLNPERRGDAYFSVLDEGGELVGFFQFELEDTTVDVGLGMRPDLTGKGLGVGSSWPAWSSRGSGSPRSASHSR